MPVYNAVYRVKSINKPRMSRQKLYIYFLTRWRACLLLFRIIVNTAHCMALYAISRLSVHYNGDLEEFMYLYCTIFQT